MLRVPGTLFLVETSHNTTCSTSIHVGWLLVWEHGPINKCKGSLARHAMRNLLDREL